MAAWQVGPQSELVGRVACGFDLVAFACGVSIWPTLATCRLLEKGAEAGFHTVSQAEEPLRMGRSSSVFWVVCLTC